MRKMFLVKASKERPLTCSGCKKPIASGKDAIVLVKFNGVFVESGGMEWILYPGDPGMKDLKVELNLKGVSPQAVIQWTSAGFDWRLKDPPIVSVHHQNGCGFNTSGYMRRLPGSFEMGKRR